MSLRELARRGRRTGGFRTVMLVLLNEKSGDADATNYYSQPATSI